MKKSSAFFIINPLSGNGKMSRSWSHWAKALQKSGISSFDYAFSRHPGHATELVREGIKKGFRLLVAVGGDGTAHEVLNGMLSQSDCPPDDLVLAVLPTGTGNDWIRSYGIPTRLPDWIRMLQMGNTRLQDIGLITCQRNQETRKRYFLNVAGLAFDANVVQYLASRPERNNQLRYLRSVVKCLAGFRAPEAIIHIDDQLFTGRFFTINIGKGRYSGGGMQLVPQAKPDDGRFAITLAESLTKREVVLNIHKLYNGRIGTHPKIKTLHGKKIKIEGVAEPIPVEADGEFLGESTVEVDILPQAIRILVP